MSKPFFSPWIGENYNVERVLVMSESTYDWIGEDGENYTPQPSHAQDSIPWHIENFRHNRYFTALNRALCGQYEPSSQRMQQAWDGYAYTIFVQESVGQGPGIRPTPEHWHQAGLHFLSLIEEIRPQKVIVTGGEMWKQMPECSLHMLDDLQAYRLLDGTLVWCLALPHPANRITGFNWAEIAETIRLFKATEFPLFTPSS